MKARMHALALVAAFTLAACDQDGWHSTDAVTEMPNDTGYDFIDTSPDTPADVPDGVPEVITGDGIVGDPCTDGGQCGGVPGSLKQCLTSVSGYAEFPGGYCSAECASAVDCGTGNVCVDFMGYKYYCLKRCSSNEDCRSTEGYTCKTIETSSGLYCLPNMGGPDY
jgi:hypothetical protein